MSFGKNLKDYRLAQNSSQKEFAMMLGISNSYMSELEANKRNPSIETVYKIATRLNVSTAFLLEGQAPPAASRRYSEQKATDNNIEPRSDLIELVSLFFVTADGKAFLKNIIRFYQLYDNTSKHVIQQLNGLLAQLNKVAENQRKLTAAESENLQAMFLELLSAI